MAGVSTPPAPSAHPSPTAPPIKLGRLRAIVLRTDGAFLLVASALAFSADIIGYTTGGGPLGAAFAGRPFTSVGMFEAHGTAFLLGLVLLYAARRPPAPAAAHLLAAGLHLLLGGFNLVFWQDAIMAGVEKLEIVVTTIHFAFLAAQIACAASSMRRQDETP